MFSQIQVHDLRSDYRSAKSQKRSGVDDGRRGAGPADNRSHAHGQNELSYEYHGTDHGHVRSQTSDLIVGFLADGDLGKL